MRPAFRRGWEGEGKPNRCLGAGQRARSDRHSGAAILLWEREGKALGVPGQSDNGAGRLHHVRKRNRQVPPAAARHDNGALARRDAAGRPAAASKSLPVARSAAPAKGRSADRPRASGKERGKSASGSARKRRALEERSGKERVFRPSRSSARPNGRPSPCASDRHRRPRRHRRLGGASPRRRACGIERDAGLPAGVGSKSEIELSVSSFASRYALCSVYYRSGLDLAEPAVFERFRRHPRSPPQRVVIV